MKKIVNILRKLESITVFLLFLIMVIMVFIQVVNRNFIKISIGWLEELARYSMIFLILLGTEMGLRDGTQISVEALTQRLNIGIRKGLKFITRAMVIYFSTMVFFNSIPLIKMQIKTGQLSPGLRVPMYLPYLTITIGFLIITLTQISTLIIDLKKTYFNKDCMCEGEDK
ncbi:TRAP transporter small permease [Cetobacterium sp. 8H]|uniref:TRAP transporter small permease n=1 Tax=Cetobacterium sp. 8H TaxID=2759681 RepID=UPI00163C9002|nr:TRAP transporter small permease [Cetobacterium sp. 8H]MBC2849889.1 TRAP transporter small permease [Cetobacterium sp. 8H]